MHDPFGDQPTGWGGWDDKTPFGVAAGSPNFAQGGVPGGGLFDRFAYSNLAWRLARADLFGEPQAEILPTHAPYSWAWSRGPELDDPEEAIAPGAAQHLSRDIWGDYYYGFYEDRLNGEPWREDASYVEAAYGAQALHALHDPSREFFGYYVPDEAFPPARHDDPWGAHELGAEAGGYGGTVYDYYSDVGGF